MYNAVTNLYNAAGDNSLSDMIDGDDYAELVKVIDPGSPAYTQLTQSWVAHYI